MAKQIKQIKSFRKGQKVFVKGLRKPGTVDRVYAKDEVLEISFGPTRADPGGWVSVFAFDEIKGYRNPFVFKDVKIGHNFRFRYHPIGGRGERGLEKFYLHKGGAIQCAHCYAIQTFLQKR